MIFFKEAISSAEVEDLLLCKQEVNLQFLTFSKVEDRSGLQFIRYLCTQADMPSKSKACVDFIRGPYWKLWMDTGTGKVIPYNFIYCKERTQEKRNRLASHCCRRVSSVQPLPNLHRFDSFSAALNIKHHKVSSKGGSQCKTAGLTKVINMLNIV